MTLVRITSVPGFEEWRDKAKRLISDGRSPSEVIWQTGSDDQNNLFAAGGLTQAPPQTAQVTMTVTKEFVELAKAVACHKNDDRFALMYKLLWRLTHENKNLLKMKTDDDVIKALTYAKAVYRDAYKITAFLRFRRVENYSTPEHYVAWYEPFHYSVERVIPFFKTRFKNMNWSILTPYRAVHWDGDNISLVDNPNPEDAPKVDDVEKYWLTYYANIFNPTRPKKGAMLSQMPKKYWKNMPETVLIDSLLKESDQRAREMIESQRESQK